jgi:hypothetical protein
MEEERIKHLEFIQNVISRLNSNSFQIKGWAITIVAAVLVLLATIQKPEFILIGIFSLILFWLMDAYCLTQERKFRGLYNDVAGISEIPKKLKPFEMNSNLYKGGYYCFWRILWTRTIWVIYWLIIAMHVVIYLYLKLK